MRVVGLAMTVVIITIPVAKIFTQQMKKKRFDYQKLSMKNTEIVRTNQGKVVD